MCSKESSGAGGVTQRLTTFTLFPKLPFELREEIWKITSNKPHTIEGRYNYRTGVWSSANNPPSVLYTCHESRVVALKAYKLAFHTFCTVPYKNRIPRIWFNDKQDMLYINRKTFFWHLPELPPVQFSEVQHMIDDMTYLSLHRIRRLAIDFSAEPYPSDQLAKICVHNDCNQIVDTARVTLTDPTRYTKLAGGNLSGLRQLPKLEEIMVVIDAENREHMKWTAKDVKRHIHYRLYLYKQLRRHWVIPKITVAWKKV
jgi:hypothetical protein